jgi:glutamate carboxypeptidase
VISPFEAEQAAAETGADAAVAALGNLRARQPDMVRLLGQLVSIESGSDDVPGLTAMAGTLRELFAEFGDVERFPAHSRGVDNLVLTVRGSRGADLPHVAVLGHYDTVWPRGTLRCMPFAVDDAGIARGPGCFDMKGGLVLLYEALRELRGAGTQRGRDIKILFDCDEELGSGSSRELVAAVGRNAVAALVLESPLPGGALKTARKGTGSYRLDITGRAAHAGIEPERGISAVVELAMQILTIDALNDPSVGTTVNIGIVEGGSRINVVPAHASARINIRVATVDEAARIDAALNSLVPVLPGATLSVTTGLARPPMIRTPASERLFERARSIAARIDMPDLRDGSTGGGSDGSLIAAQGVPTLDGLGPEGGGAHADDEHVIVESMPRRAALLAGLLADLAR